MCAGANAAKQANRNAKIQHRYRQWDRFHKGIQRYSRYGIQKVQAEIQQFNIFQVLAGKYGSWSRAQTKYNKFKQNMMKEGEVFTRKLLQESTYGKLLAKGNVTGKSVARMGVLEAAQAGQYFATNARKLTDARDQLELGMAYSRIRAKTAQDQTFANVAFAPTADIESAAPAQRSVGMAMFGDVMSGIGSAVGIAAALSDSRLKKDVKKIGTSLEGHNIYKFKYLDEENEYIGVMAEEVLKKKPEAVGYMGNGYFGVDYNQIDVEFREVA